MEAALTAIFHDPARLQRDRRARRECTLDELLHSMGLTEVRAARGGIERVLRRMVEEGKIVYGDAEGHIRSLAAARG